MKSHLSILSLIYWDAGVLLRKSLPIPISSRVFLVPSFSNFRVSGLIFRSLIHFELLLVQGDRHGSSFSFLETIKHFSQQHLLKRLSFLHHIFLALLSKIRWVSCVDSYLVLYSTGLNVCFCGSTMLFLLLLCFVI
jgi:hypothetical protein